MIVALSAATIALVTITILALSGTILSRAITVEGTPGGTIEVLYSRVGLTDLDPARVQAVETTIVTRATLRTPYTWRPDRPLAPVPDLAEGVPQITDGGRRVTIQLRSDVRFAPPVNRPITSADIAYAISRAFRPSVDGEVARRWFAAVEGVDAVRRGEAVVASGLQTPDDHTLVVQLTKPAGRVVAEAMTLEVAAPVPREYAQPFDDRPRSTYAEHQVASGPYRLAAAPDGRLLDPVADRLQLVRNPNWDADTDDRPAFVDRFVLRLRAGDAASVLDETFQGQGRIAADVIPGSADQVPPGRGDQLVAGQAGSTTFLALNVQARPLDDVAVRRAVVAAADRRALSQGFGGVIDDQVATHWIPPGLPGFEQAGGTRGAPLPWLADPHGSVATARALLRQAGPVEGTIRIGVPGLAAADGTVARFVARLRAVGLRARIEEIAPADYLDRCRAGGVDGPSCFFSWVPELRDPQAMLEPLFGADAGATNLSHLDDPALDRRMADAARLQGAGDRAAAWGEIDRDLAALAPGVPIEWSTDLNVRSADVRAYIDPGTGSWALPYLSRG